MIIFMVDEKDEDKPLNKNFSRHYPNREKPLKKGCGKRFTNKLKGVLIHSTCGKYYDGFGLRLCKACSGDEK